MLPLRMLGSLMLMFLLCDADSTCSPERNPLTLDPPEVIGKYGESVLVNCTSKVDDHDGMYWRQTVNKNVKQDSEKEVENNYIFQYISLSDWDVTAECKINLSETPECSKELEITVYKNPDEVTMFPIRYVKALVEGTQYELQCDVFNVAPVRNLIVRWYKDDQTIKTESFTNKTTKRAVDVSSTLTVNISREENGAQFRCEAQLDFGPNGPQPPESSEIHHVSVHYAPELKNRMDIDYVIVNEGNDVTLNCEAEGNPPPVFHWTGDGVNISENTNNLNLTRVHTNATYHCTATNDLGSTTKQIRVYVVKTTNTTARVAMTIPEASAPRDADSTCSPERNPLTLDPPEVIGKYGESVLVNCTSKVDDHDGMYWRQTVNKNVKQDSEKEVENNYIFQYISLSDWDVTAECKINLSETPECSKELEITVYKNPDVVTMFPIRYVKALVEGTQYELQCDVVNVAPVRNLIVRWYKDDQTIKTESFTNKTTKRAVDVSSTLTVNISREENGAQFRCEAQLDFGPNGPQPPESSEIHHVSVHYAPELKNRMDIDYVIVNEGNDVTLNCEAEGNPPPVFHWTGDGVNISENTNNLNLTRVHTNATYHCTATNDLGSTTKQIPVYVVKTTNTTARVAMTIPEASAPRGCPLILSPAEIVVRFGDPASVNCSTSATNASGMGWEAAMGGTGFKNPPAVTWMVEKLKVWTFEPTCFITLADNHQCQVTPDITVYKTPDNVSVSALNHGPMVEGTEYLLNCNIADVAPVQKLTVKWYRGNEIVHTQQTFNGTSVAPVNVSSTLKVTPERGYNAAHFRCAAELHLGPAGPELVPTATSSPYIAVVLYAPVIKEGNYSMEVKSGENVTFGCLAEGNPLPMMRWIPPAGNVRETTGLGQVNISVKEATSTDAGVYICVASNSVGNVTRHLTVTLKGESTAPPLAVSWWFLILFVIVFIIILIMIIFFNHMKKHGRYSFVPDKDIPMTTPSDRVQA